MSLAHPLRRIALVALPAILAALCFAPGSLRAAESTGLSGSVDGLEICPQVWCGAAVFIGRFDGALNGTAGEGRWWVAVRHEALPLLPGASAPITGGEWGIMVGERPLRGSVSAGSILNNGDGTFTVTPRLDVVLGGEGRLSLSILLDHALFPPAVLGSVAEGDVELPVPPRIPAPAPPAPAGGWT